MKKLIFILLFIEFVAMFVCGAMHLTLFLIGHSFPLDVYVMVGAIAFVSVLLTKYVFEPISKRLLS